MSQRVAIKNLSAVLEAAGSNLNNAVKVNVFLTTMDDFAPMNQVYDEFFGSISPKPVSRCVCLSLAAILLPRLPSSLWLTKYSAGLVLPCTSCPLEPRWRLNVLRSCSPY